MNGLTGRQSGMMPFKNSGFGQMGSFTSSDPIGMSGLNGMMALGQQQQMMSSVMDQMMTSMLQMMMRQMQTMMSSLANFGGVSQGNQSRGSGLNSFYGGSGGLSGASGSSSAGGSSEAQSVGSGGFGGATAFGSSLAADAGKNANGPGGYCYKWVANALGRKGVSVHGASAYMAGDQLAKNGKFREIKVETKDLPKLPAGAVVVWNKGAGHPHGHISIALGNGKEASDKLRTQITNYGTSVRVFLPK